MLDTSSEPAAAIGRSGAGDQQLGLAQASPTITIVESGEVAEIEATRTHRFESGSLVRVTNVRIGNRVAYSQFSSHHLLHVTLQGSTVRTSGQVGGADWVHRADRAGAISFTSCGHERRGITRRGDIKGLEVSLPPWFIDEVCEQRITAWRDRFNAEDAKGWAVAAMIAAQISHSDRDPLTLDHLMVMLARQIGRAYGNAPRRRDDGWLHPAALVRIVEQVRHEPGRSIMIGDMAREAGLGISAFIRAFRGSTGTTPAALVHQIRLNRAAEMLMQTHHPIAEIASLTGFASASHLTRSFRVRRGVTPARWRQQARRAGIANTCHEIRENQ
jgi:AraC-like DNA-binding protein